MGCPRGWLPKPGSGGRPARVRPGVPRVGSAGVKSPTRHERRGSAGEHGSPLWLANLDVVRDRKRSFTAAWGHELAGRRDRLLHKANRLPAILRTLAERASATRSPARPSTASRARSQRGRAGWIVVQGPASRRRCWTARPPTAPRSIADGWPSCGGSRPPAESRRVGVRVCLPGVGHGTSQFGVPMAELTAMAPRHAAALGLRSEALAFTSCRPGSTGRCRDPAPGERAGRQDGRSHPSASRRRPRSGRPGRAMGVPVVDIGGGLSPAPDESALRANHRRAHRWGRLRGPDAGRTRARDRGRGGRAGRDGAGRQTAVGPAAMRRRRRGDQPAAGDALRVADVEAPEPRPTAGPALVVGPVCRNSRSCIPRSTAGYRRGRCPRCPRRRRLPAVAIDAVGDLRPRGHRPRRGNGVWSDAARRWRTSSPPTSAPTFHRPRANRWRDGAAPASSSTAPATGPEVLLVHPGGPFWAKRDLGAWSIPKGECDDGEDPRAAAPARVRGGARERAARRGALELGEVRQKGGKVVTAWAAGRRPRSRRQMTSNTFEMEWPPRSGRSQEFPEVDRAGWFALEVARAKLNSAQVELVDRLVERVISG